MPTGSDLRILILEDVSTDAELIERRLREDGIAFVSHIASTRETFASALDAFDPDIVIADYRLPEFNGREALRIVRARNPDLPFVLVSGALGDDDAVDLIKEGASDYVLKDRMARLPAAVRRAVAEADESRAKRWAEAETRETLRRTQAQLDAIGRINRADALLAGDVEALAREVTELASAVTGCERVNAWVFNEGETELTCIDLFEATPGRHSSGAVLREAEYRHEFEALKAAPYVAVDDPLTDPRTAGYVEGYLKPSGIASMLDAVIRVSDKNLGLLCFEHVGKRHAWRPDEINFACRLADQIGLAMISRQRKRAEERLHASRDLLHTVVESAPVRIFWKDSELRYLGCNAAFARDAGMSRPEDLIGKDDFQMGWRDQAELYRADDRRVIDSGTPVIGYEEPQTTPDGPTIWLRTSKVPLRDDAGKVMGILGVYDDITERKRAEAALRKTMRVLRVLSAGNAALVQANNEAALLSEMCRILVDVGGYRMAWIGFAQHDEAKTVRPAVHAGRDDGYLDTANIVWADTERGRGPTGTAIRTGMPQVNRNVADNPVMTPWREAAAARGYASSIALPLKGRSGTFGALTIYAPEPDAFDTDEVKLLVELSSDLSYGISALRDRAENKVAAERLRRSMETTVEVVAGTLEHRDPYTAGHQRRVAILAEAMARRMGLAEDRIHGLRLAGIVHDLGKIYIPAEILSKPSRLTPIEYEMIKTHPQVGHDILKNVDFPWPIAKMVVQHHERMDGTGYPNGLKGDEIVPEARILAVADVVESMMSHRPYRPSRGIDVALAEIEQGRGTAYDPAAVDACLTLFRQDGFEFD